MPSDVCLILEGSYPYVAGGVSTWVAQLLTALPDLSFSLLFIGASRDAPRSLKYEIPHNVIELQERFLFESPDREGAVSPPWPLTSEETAALARFVAGLSQGDAPGLTEVSQIMARFPSRDALFLSLSHSREAWRMVERQYEALAPAGLSFLDFFWTFRSIVVPTLCVLHQPPPAARLYHSASTGYAGMLGARAAFSTGAPLVVTEHGLYTRERRMEIFSAGWIVDSGPTPHLDMRRGSSYLRDWWNNFFLALSRSAYRRASRVFSLCEVNRQLQVADGAAPEKAEVIPNGIDTTLYEGLRPRPRRAGEPLQIGYIGRIASIKDVKTLLHALAILQRRKVPFECQLMGPMDEEPEYAADCRQLAAALGLGDKARFLGRVQVAEHLPKLDVVVLTSLSEGMPFAVLEANCAGLPVVVTDVGACREMVLGRLPEDKALGASGLLTPPGSPAATAAALERLARLPDLARRMGEAGRQRARRFYDIRDVMRQYREVYQV